jgi:hypothetical protein
VRTGERRRVETASVDGNQHAVKTCGRGLGILTPRFRFTREYRGGRGSPSNFIQPGSHIHTGDYKQ